MRLRTKAWGAAVLVPVVLLFAGCSGGSIVPGQGMDGGLGSIGTDTGNPDEALVMRVKGSPYGDFVADTVRLVNPPDIRRVEAKQEYRVTNRHALRTIQLEFTSAPVQGQTYSAGSDVDITFVETPYVRDPKNAGKQILGSPQQWVANGGSVRITRLDATRMDAEFSAALKPDINASGNLTFTNGLLHLKF